MSRLPASCLTFAVAVLLLASCRPASPPSGATTSGAGGSTNAGGSTGSNACAVLTQAEIEQAVGVPVGAGVPNASGTNCTWRQESQGVGLDVTVDAFDQDMWNAFKRAQNAQVASGIGDDAFTSGQTIHVKKDSKEATVVLVANTMNQQQLREAQVQLAKSLVARM